MSMRKAVGLGVVVSLAVLLLALAGQVARGGEVASAPDASSDDEERSEVEQLKARVVELEAELAEVQAKLKKAREKNGQFVLENGRLRRLCEKAGVDPDAKPVPEQPEQPVPQAPVPPPVPEQLTGEALDAWKLANEAVAGEMAKWSDKLAIIYGEGRGWKGEMTGTKVSEPTTQYLRQTNTGDYVVRFEFYFLLGKKPVEHKTVDVPVINYGTELRAVVPKTGTLWIQ